jgi:hypothetical protein
MNSPKFASAVVVAALACISLGAPQRPPRTPDTEPPPVRLPNGKLQTDEILKADYEQNLKDLKQMQKLMDEIRGELEKNEQYVLSLGAIKKLEEIEKLSQKVRGRMRRW